MKKFHSGKYIEKALLKENNITYPIRLDYYSIKNNENEEIYGLEVVKTEYRENGIRVESKKIDRLTKDEKKLKDILTNLSQGFVTPICLQEIVDEYFPFTIAN